MDFPAQLEALQTNVAEARADVQAAAAESRDRLRQRIDKAQVDVNRAALAGSARCQHRGRERAQ